jgi:hypothetical protein
MNRTTTTIALVLAKTVLGAGLALGFATAPHGVAHTGYDAYAAEVGDDNADGRIDEDESGWNCAEMGNLRCGPVSPGTGAMWLPKVSVISSILGQ